MVCVNRALALVLCCAAGGPLLAEDASGGSAQGDLKILRQMIEQQSRQIDVLAQEIARLNLLLEAKTPAGAGLVPSPAEAPSPASAPPGPAPKAVAAEETPGPPGPVHIVAKGETLTAIARRYKVTVSELLKVNKITDVRKLQIGQSLTLPPDAKLQESASPTPQQ